MHPARLPLGLISAFVLGGLPRAQASGFVVDASTLAPIPDALVSVQAAPIRTTTAADGSFDLPGATGGSVLLVAAKKGYFNASAFVVPPVSGVQLAMEAVPQEDDPTYDFMEPDTCGSCHIDQRDQWLGSPMANAGSNTWVYDLYDGSGTPGGLGGFVYTRDSRLAASNPASECAACHQPEPWIQAPHTALDDIDNLSTEALHGISCEVCHKIADIDESKVNFPGIYPGAVTFTRPGPASTQIQYGNLGDTASIFPSYMRPSYQPQLEAAVCAACHQDKNDPDEDGDFEEPNGIVSEPTYLEWLDSPYGDPESEVYASCVDCHMPSYGATRISVMGGVIRDPETIRYHRIEGTTAPFLESAAELDMDCEWIGGELRVDVSVTNTGTGHHVPTGVTVRNMILLVEASRVSDGQSLVQAQGPTVDTLGGVGDPAQGYYAGLPGRLFAKFIRDENGNGPTFFTDAAEILWDNRIPALATDQSSYVFDAPPGIGEVRVRARLIYRRSFRALVDAKQWTMDGHGNPLEDIAAPHFGHLMEELDFTCSPGVVVYGCGTNPPRSLSVVQGAPVIGQSLVLGVDNPLGTQNSGSLAYLYVSSRPESGFPCGRPLPNWGMSAPGSPGELLIDLQPPKPIQILGGGAWSAPGSPVRIPVHIPADPGLVGELFYAQGAIFDPGGPIPHALTNAAKFTIGAHRARR